MFMNIWKYILLGFLALGSTTAGAQKKHPKAKVVTKTMTETPAQRLFQSMLPSTAKVMFIDSIVVGKRDFLSHVPLNSESGMLTARSHVVGNDMQVLTQYENEFGDRRFFAEGDTAATVLRSQSLLGGQWSSSASLPGISTDDYLFQNFPFLASDGVTLYFSATGHNSLGERDIFMTNFDSDKGEWYAPQNYGLPFNSSANDYLLAIDDLDTLGWLVSDRYQPHDSVCIYTFVPTSTRQDFTNDGLSPKQLEKYARVAAIRDTWPFGNRDAAIARRNEMLQRMKKGKNVVKGNSFVVDDQTVITSASQLKNAESRKLFDQLSQVDELIRQTEASLEADRMKYQSGKNTELNAKILRQEKDLLKQRADYRMLEKKIRRAEKQ
ncbi:MAG: hypothetical protein Q4E32_08170 [Bacteroidales bacterium]|nr:hypothetical protein [Bacteroidales bacterium]